MAANSSEAGTEAASPERRQACTSSLPPAVYPRATSWASGDASAASARPVCVEHRDVPVALGRRASFTVTAPGPETFTLRVATPGAARPVRAVAGGRVRAFWSGERGVEHRPRREQRRAAGGLGGGGREGGDDGEDGDQEGAAARVHAGDNAVSVTIWR